MRPVARDAPLRPMFWLDVLPAVRLHITPGLGVGVGPAAHVVFEAGAVPYTFFDAQLSIHGLLALACSGPPEQPTAARPNFLIIDIDTFSVDHLGAGTLAGRGTQGRSPPSLTT